MDYRDLITYDRLKAADSAKITENEEEPEIRAVIQGVSSLIRSRLGRVVIVEAETQRFAPHDWTEDATTYASSDMQAYADEQPLVQIAPDEDQPSDVVDGVEIRTDRTFRAPTNAPGALRYFAGWRRPGQVLSNPGSGETVLPTGTDEALEGLTTLPQALPAVFQEVAIDLTLHVLKRRDENLGQRSTRSIGGQEIVVEGADSGFIRRQISRLSRFDRSHVLS
jgi:hypothetical protein